MQIVGERGLSINRLRKLCLVREAARRNLLLYYYGMMRVMGVGTRLEAKANTYPGETAQPTELIALAGQFQRAAEQSVKIVNRGQYISSAPFRLLCLHAIELYLNAFLIHCGEQPPSVRGLQHNLCARLELLDKHKLILKLKTRAHLAEISTNREYLVSRYAPEVQIQSQINRLQATLAEVEGKVRKRLCPPITTTVRTTAPKCPGT